MYNRILIHLKHIREWGRVYRIENKGHKVQKQGPKI